MIKPKTAYYHIGLGNKVLRRARIIFGVAFLIVFLVSATAVYAGVKNGEIDRLIKQPINNLVASIDKILTEQVSKAPDSSPSFIATSSATVNIDINSSTGTSKKSYGNTKLIYPTYPPVPTYSSKSYEQLVQEMNERAAKAREEQDKWFEQQKEANKQWSAEQSTKNSQQAQDWFDQQVQLEQLKLEEWKKEHGF